MFIKNHIKIFLLFSPNQKQHFKAIFLLKNIRHPNIFNKSNKWRIRSAQINDIKPSYC